MVMTSPSPANRPAFAGAYQCTGRARPRVANSAWFADAWCVIVI